MRVLLIALMIALLPVRGWVGGAMAIAMNDLPAAQTAASHGHHGEAGHAGMDHASMDHASMDHASMDHASMDHSTTDGASPHAHSTCDVCNGPVMTSAVAPMVLTTARHALRVDRVESFASHSPPSGLKPPIA